MRIRISNAVRHMPYLIHLVPNNGRAFEGSILMIPNDASIELSPVQVTLLEKDIRSLNRTQLHPKLGPFRRADLFVVDGSQVSAIEADELFEFIQQGIIS